MTRDLEPKVSLVAGTALLMLLCGGCPDFFHWRSPWGGRDGFGRGHHPRPPVAGSGGSTSGDPAKPNLPRAVGECPELATGTVSINGIDVRLWAGRPDADQHGPLLVYWHGTGSTPQEVDGMVSGVRDEIIAQGGLVAAFAETTETGQNTGTGTWFTGDFAIVDQLVGCAVEQLGIDVTRIYTAGCSFGAVQAGALAYGRSNYIAGAMLNSGGLVNPITLQDPARTPAVITAHGSSDSDVVIVDFADASVDYDRDLVSRGGFAVDCDHGGGHCAAPAALVSAQWQFLKAHPYGVDPEPYAAGLPASFPDYCEIIE